MIDVKSILTQTTSQVSSSMDKLLNLPESKTLNKDEQKEVLTGLASFIGTLKKQSKSGLIPPELKDISNAFEKANYDITRMPKEFASSLKRTYEDFSEVIKQEPGYFKDRAAKAYCDSYELFTGVKFKNFVNKLKSSKGVKKILHSKENYNPSIESFDAYISSTNYDQSEEAIDPFGIGKALGGAASEFNGLMTSVNTLSSIVIISVVIISIMIICMCIMSSMYQDKLIEAIEAITESQTGKKLDKSAVVKNMEESMPKATKTFLVKPTIGCTKFINKITEPKTFNGISKGIDTLDKYSDQVSKENYDQSEEFFLSGMIAGLATFAAANPIVIAVGVIAALILVVHLLRAAIYWVGHFRLKISTILKEQSEIIDTNIIALIDKANDPSTPKSEKERLLKVIERQKNMAKNLSGMSDAIYKTEASANADTSYDLKEDSKINYDKIVDETNRQVQETQQETTDIIVNEPESAPSGSASIIF